MAKEYEVVSHPHLNHINAFLVRLVERSTHVHRDLELGLVLEGSVTLKISHGSYRLKEQDIYLVNPMEAHELISDGSGALLLAIQLSPLLTEPVFPDASNIRYLGSVNLRECFPDAPRRYLLLGALCVELACSYLARRPNYELKCLSLAATLFHLLHTAIPWEVMSREDYLPMKQRTDRILSITDYIEQNFRRKLLLNEIARRESLSLTYLSHFFKDALGMTFQEYLNQKRFEYACHLLATTDRKILDISLSSGFSDVRYFNQTFQAQFGCTPRDYRRGKHDQFPEFRMLTGTTQHFFTPEDTERLLAEPRRDLRERIKGESLFCFFEE